MAPDRSDRNISAENHSHVTVFRHFLRRNAVYFHAEGERTVADVFLFKPNPDRMNGRNDSVDQDSPALLQGSAGKFTFQISFGGSGVCICSKIPDSRYYFCFWAIFLT